MKKLNEKQNPTLEGMGEREARRFLTGLFSHLSSEEK